MWLSLFGAEGQGVFVAFLAYLIHEYFPGVVLVRIRRGLAAYAWRGEVVHEHLGFSAHIRAN
jgi:hypothetical protein